eukprot:15365673-Ditylum_brightwellii.AAC.3
MEISGERDRISILWRASIQQNSTNNMLKTTTIGKQMQFLHATAGYPVSLSWINAVNRGYYITMPELMAETICKHLPKSPITTSGYIEQKRKNIQSTKRLDDKDKLDIDYPQEEDNIKIHKMFGIIVEKGKMFSNQTG